MEIRERLGRLAGYTINLLVVLVHTVVFVNAMAALWGLYFFGLINCFVLVLLAFSKNGYIRNLRRQPVRFDGLTLGNRIAILYFVSLLTIAVVFNIFFLVTYFLGIYRPFF